MVISTEEKISKQFRFLEVTIPKLLMTQLNCFTIWIILLLQTIDISMTFIYVTLFHGKEGNIINVLIFERYGIIISLIIFWIISLVVTLYIHWLAMWLEKKMYFYPAPQVFLLFFLIMVTIVKVLTLLWNNHVIMFN